MTTMADRVSKSIQKGILMLMGRRGDGELDIKRNDDRSSRHQASGGREDDGLACSPVAYIA